MKKLKKVILYIVFFLTLTVGVYKVGSIFKEDNFLVQYLLGFITTLFFVFILSAVLLILRLCKII